MTEALLQIDDLRVEFATRRGKAMVLNGVSFEVHAGETLCVVGESGCGKSMTALAILGLVPQPPGRVAGGAVRFQGEDLVHATPERLRAVRGNRISMIFQEPMTSLNPVYTVGEQIAESLRLHAQLDRKAAHARAIEMLRQVGIPAPERRVDEYPHQLSGGMRQRVMIAMALACRPDILIADEPTTALDVTVQAQILDLLRRLQAEMNMSILFITHNLGVVAEIAHRVAVMYAGRVVEDAGVYDLFEKPTHPYTRGLLSCLPTAALLASGERLRAIPGNVPSVLSLPAGCTFAPRCALADDNCRRDVPELVAVQDQHRARCIKVTPL